LDTVIEWVIFAMRRIEPELGLGAAAEA